MLGGSARPHTAQPWLLDMRLATVCMSMYGPVYSICTQKPKPIWRSDRTQGREGRCTGSARTVHGRGSAALDKAWARRRRVWTLHGRGFAVFAEQMGRVDFRTGGIPGVTANARIWPRKTSPGIGTSEAIARFGFSGKKARQRPIRCPMSPVEEYAFTIVSSSSILCNSSGCCPFVDRPCCFHANLVQHEGQACYGVHHALCARCVNSRLFWTHIPRWPR